MIWDRFRETGKVWAHSRHSCRLDAWELPFAAECFDTKAKTFCVVKVYPSPLGRRLRFKVSNEATVHGGACHLSIIKLLDVIEDHRGVCLVLEHGGSTVYNLLKQQGKWCRSKIGPLPEPQVLKGINSVLEGLAYLHNKGVIHRDIKPGNLMCCNGNWKIIDFGDSVTQEFCHQVRSEVSQGEGGQRSQRRPLVVAGTHQYMPCEYHQLLLEAAEDREAEAVQVTSSKIDTWSLGITVYLCLYGVYPFTEGVATRHISEAIVHRELTFPSHPEVSPLARHFISTALLKDPRLRPTCTELLSHPWIVCGPQALWPVPLGPPEVCWVHHQVKSGGKPGQAGGAASHHVRAPAQGPPNRGDTGNATKADGQDLSTQEATSSMALSSWEQCTTKSFALYQGRSNWGPLSETDGMAGSSQQEPNPREPTKDSSHAPRCGSSYYTMDAGSHPETLDTYCVVTLGVERVKGQDGERSELNFTAPPSVYKTEVLSTNCANSSCTSATGGVCTETTVRLPWVWLTGKQLQPGCQSKSSPGRSCQRGCRGGLGDRVSPLLAPNHNSSCLVTTRNNPNPVFGGQALEASSAAMVHGVDLSRLVAGEPNGHGTIKEQVLREENTKEEAQGLANPSHQKKVQEGGHNKGSVKCTAVTSSPTSGPARAIHFVLVQWFSRVRQRLRVAPHGPEVMHSTTQMLLGARHSGTVL